MDILNFTTLDTDLEMQSKVAMYKKMIDDMADKGMAIKEIEASIKNEAYTRGDYVSTYVFDGIARENPLLKSHIWKNRVDCVAQNVLDDYYTEILIDRCFCVKEGLEKSYKNETISDYDYLYVNTPEALDEMAEYIRGEVEKGENMKKQVTLASGEEIPELEPVEIVVSNDGYIMNTSKLANEEQVKEFETKFQDSGHSTSIQSIGDGKSAKEKEIKESGIDFE